MAKTEQAPDLVITITLPEQDITPRTGRIVVSRGELATVHQFEYLGLDEIMQAIQNEAGRLIAVEENPPPKDVVAPKKADTAKLIAKKDEQPAATQAELPAGDPAAQPEVEAAAEDADEPTEETEPVTADTAE